MVRFMISGGGPRRTAKPASIAGGPRRAASPIGGALLLCAALLSAPAFAAGERYAAKSLNFEWLDVYNGLEVIEKAGTALAEDAGHTLRTPYDNSVLIMPTRSKRFTVGSTMLRFGRVESLT